MVTFTLGLLPQFEKRRPRVGFPSETVSPHTCWSFPSSAPWGAVTHSGPPFAPSSFIKSKHFPGSCSLPAPGWVLELEDEAAWARPSGTQLGGHCRTPSGRQGLDRGRRTPAGLQAGPKTVNALITDEEDVQRSSTQPRQGCRGELKTPRHDCEKGQGGRQCKIKGMSVSAGLLRI